MSTGGKFRSNPAQNGSPHSARDIGGDIGSALVGAFTSAESAIGDFVKTGKLDFRDLVTSMIADLAKLAARRFILGPIANALSGALVQRWPVAQGIRWTPLHAPALPAAVKMPKPTTVTRSPAW